MSQEVIFSIGVSLLILTVMLMIWMGEPSETSRTFRTQKKLKVEVQDPQGKPLQDEAVISALEEALSAAKVRNSIQPGARSTPL